MRVLVTGIDGYIGALLAPVLQSAGHDVVGVDTGYYREGWLYTDPSFFARSPPVINKDLRAVERADLEGVQAVVHLAELSNDPLGENDPEVTFDINHRGSVRLAALAKDAGVDRFVYTSSCSVYGVSDAELVDETSAVDPQTAYARCKVLVERDVAPMADEGYCPVFLRNATAFGASPRMRFDVVLNNLAALAWTTNRIAMTSDGTPWRPLVHALDICAAVEAVLAAPAPLVRGQVFNVGNNAANYRVRDIAGIVQETFPDCEITFGPPDADNRSYRVSFDRIHATLPAFRCRWDALKGAIQLRELFARIRMPRETFEFRAFTRVRQLRHLIRTRQIDERFYWKVPAASGAEP